MGTSKLQDWLRNGPDRSVESGAKGVCMIGTKSKRVQDVGVAVDDGLM